MIWMGSGYHTNLPLPYTLYQYSGGEIPDREGDGTAVDLFSDAINGINPDAQNNLNLLLDDLLARYQRDGS
jgi:hypothetical protein